MKKIYKYRLPMDGHVIDIDDYVVEFLHVGTQNGVPMVWAVVDPEEEGNCEVVAWGTGWDLPNEVYNNCDYIGTCEDGYGYVWHYFARFKEEPKASTGVCGWALDSAASSADISVSLDEDALNRILGLTTKSVEPNVYTITYGVADGACATAAKWACA